MTRRHGSWRALALVLLAMLVAQGAVAERLRLAVLGHLRGNADGEQNPWLAEIVEQVGRDDPDVVVLTGDQVWGDYHAERVDGEAVEADWQALEQALAPLSARLLFVAGNHDINDPTTRDIFVRRYGARPSAERIGNVLLLLLDSTRIDDRIPTPSPRAHVRPPELDPEQVRWIESTLAAHADAEHVFVFLHHVLWWENDAAWWSTVHPILARHPTRAVFAGDFGPLKFSHVERDGIDYVQSAVEGSSHVQTARTFESARVMNYQFENFVLVETDGPRFELTVRALAALETGKMTPERHHRIFSDEKSLRERFDEALGGPLRRSLLALLVLLGVGAGALLGYGLGRRRRT